MASSLQEFLEIKPDNTELTDELEVKAVNGRYYEVKFKALPYEQFAQIKARSMYSYTNLNGTTGSQVEEFTFCLNLCAAALLEPDPNDRQLRKVHRTHDSRKIITNMFTNQSILAIGGAIMDLTLREVDDDEQIEVSTGVSEKKLKEAKN